MSKFFDIFIFSSFEQSLKTWWPNSVRLSGKSIVVKLLQPKNAPPLIASILSGILIYFKFLQL